MEEISFRRSAPRWWAVARVITVVALTAGCLTAVGTSAQAANLEQHNPVTDRRHCPAPRNARSARRRGAALQKVLTSTIE